MEDQTIIHFVRHGNVHNPNKIYYGRLLGFPLSDSGKLQVNATRDFFSKESIDAFYSSPQLRARETAQIIISSHDNKFVVVSDLLNEAYTPFDGCPKSLLDERKWDVYTGVDPSYEQPSDVLSRGQRFISEIRKGHSGQQIVAVTHGDFIAFLVLWFKGILCTPQNKQLIYDEKLAYASVTTLIFETNVDGKFIGMNYTAPFEERGK